MNISSNLFEEEITDNSRFIKANPLVSGKSVLFNNPFFCYSNNKKAFLMYLTNY